MAHSFLNVLRREDDASSEDPSTDLISELYEADIKLYLDLLKTGQYDQLPKLKGPLATPLQDLANTLKAQGKETLSNMVSLSVGLSQETITTANMLRDTRQIDEKAKRITAATDEMVNSVSEISSTTALAAKEMTETHEVATLGMSTTQRAVETMQRIADSVDHSAQTVQQLSESSKDIEKILADIEAIASQTNLLALNAAIEAARAGEAGKGFAVVASEVKSLAQQTSSATDDIRDRIDNLRNGMSSIIQSMEEGVAVVQEGESVIAETGEEMTLISQKISNANEKMQEINHILIEQKSATQEVSENISDVSDKISSNLSVISELVDYSENIEHTILKEIALLMNMDIHDKTLLVAKSDHVLWLKRLAAMVVGKESLNPHELADHRSCRLGKWYGSVTDPTVLQHPAYTALEAPHQIVHACGIKAAEYFHKGDLNACLEQIAQVQKASEEVLHHLDALVSRHTASQLKQAH